MSNSLDQDHDRHFVGPDLSSNCFQRLFADDKSFKHFILEQNKKMFENLECLLYEVFRSI